LFYFIITQNKHQNRRQILMPPFSQHQKTDLKKSLRALERCSDVQKKEKSPATTSLGLSALDDALPDAGLEHGVIHEIVPQNHTDFPAALGFAAGLVERLSKAHNLPVLWCSLGRGLDHPPRLFPPGLPALGLSPDKILHIDVQNEREMLWVLEEALSCPACPLLIAALNQPEKLYDFTASRRLSLRAARHKGTLFLIRHHLANHHLKGRGATAAATRWSIATRPSQPFFFTNAKMPGFSRPRWQVALTRCKRGRPNLWELEWDHETFSFRLAAPLADRTTAPDLPASTEADIYKISAFR
jgi:protein ImuA